MMKTFTKFFALFVVLFGTGTAFAQLPTPLYAGYRSGNQLNEIDTTGGTWTVVGSTFLSTDLGGSVNGIKGIATDPTDDQIYVLYGWNSSSGLNRRLGQLDVMTGSITDVGPANQGASDIDFDSDGQMYVNNGDGWGTSYAFGEMDKTTATTTPVLVSASTNWGSGTIAYEPFDDDFMFMGTRNGRFNRINQDAGTQTIGSMAMSGQAHAAVALNDNTAWFNEFQNLYELNTNTGAVTYVGNISFEYHSMGFGPTPCDEITVDVSSYAFCEGEEVTLTGTSPTGGTITWSDGVENGVAFDPGPDGIYEYYIFSDSEEDCPIEEPFVIEVIGLPTVIAGAGDRNFCVDESITLSAAGDAHLYEWNDGAELDLMPGVGEYTFTLTGYYTEGGCLGENDDEVTVTVHDLPVITATADDDIICLGLDVTLNGDGGESYEWDMGVMDGVAFSPNTLGTTTYTVTGTDENGCENTATVDVEVVEGITINVESFTIETEGDDGEINIFITGGAPAYVYDWDNDGTGDFDDPEDLTGLTEGTYTLVVMGEGGCEATRTFDMWSQLSIEDNENNVLTVYPNPTVDNVQISLAGTFQYELIDMNGQILVSGTATDNEELSLDAYASGVYFVNVASGENTSTVKVVKK